MPDADVAARLSTEGLGESELLLDLARQIEGFGGIYYEPDGGRLVVAVTEEGRGSLGVARAAFSAALRAETSPVSSVVAAPAAMVERVVEHTFLELAQRTTQGLNHGTKSRKSNQDCTICVSCRWGLSGSIWVK